MDQPRTATDGGHCRMLLQAGIQVAHGDHRKQHPAVPDAMCPAVPQIPAVTDVLHLLHTGGGLQGKGMCRQQLPADHRDGCLHHHPDHQGVQGAQQADTSGTGSQGTGSGSGGADARTQDLSGQGGSEAAGGGGRGGLCHRRCSTHPL